MQELERQSDGKWLVHGLQRHPGQESDEAQTQGPFDAVVLADSLAFQPGMCCLRDTGMQTLAGWLKVLGLVLILSCLLACDGRQKDVVPAHSLPARFILLATQWRISGVR